MNASIFRIRDLVKDYDHRRVLEIPALDIQQGEFLALVGPSGAGKSSLLRLLNFLEKPSGGTIEFDRQVFTSNNDMPLETRRKVTTVFQRPLLLDCSVWDNLHFGLRLRGQRDSKREIQAALEQVGLASLAHQRARKLSAGEAQRVALARAILLRPLVLLLDEPTANLDPYNAGLIEEILQNQHRQQGTTLLMVTHNIFQAKRLADRTALLLDGQFVEIAENNVFFNRPSDPRTAAFVRGEMIY